MLVLREEEHANAIFALVAEADVHLFRDFGEELVADLQHDAHAVAGLALSVLAGAVLQSLDDGQCIADGLVALAALDVHHSADAAGVVLKLGVIQAEGRGVFRIMFHCLSHPCRKIKILTTAAHSAASDTEKQKRRPKGADSAPLERLCSGTYNYTER